MSNPFLGEIRAFSFNFPPKGWAFCNGQLLPINQNQALFAVLGTTYGGDGTANFALPNLQGRSPVHQGGSEEYVTGEEVGVESVTLLTTQLPAHTHAPSASSASASTSSPAGALWAANGDAAWSGSTPDTTMAGGAVGAGGGGQPHENRSPYLVVTYCIALQGIFPTQN